jgi:hypothetical protein
MIGSQEFADKMCSAKGFYGLALFSSGMPDDTETGTHPATSRSHLGLDIKLTCIPVS